MILDDTKVRNADKIFVLEEGRIQEEGTHAELIANSGLYFNLVKKQSTSKSLGDLAGLLLPMSLGKSKGMLWGCQGMKELDEALQELGPR